MARFTFTFSLLILLFLCAACERESPVKFEPVTIADSNIARELKIVEIEQVDYDSLIIKSRKDLKLEAKYVSKIILRDEQPPAGINVRQDTILPGYSGSDGSYQLLFQHGKKVDDSELVYKFSLEFLFNDGSAIWTDTLAVMFKYPYKSTDVYKNFVELVPDPSLRQIQDFDMNSARFFYHPFGALGLYSYQLNSKVFDTVLGYPGGDYIAVNDTLAFIDYSHDQIQRFNLNKGAVDLTFDLSQFMQPGLVIRGMDVAGENLYVFLHIMEDSYLNVKEVFLAKYDLQGNFVSSQSYPKRTFGLTVADNILYSYDFDTDEITRFDMMTQSFLKNIPTPGDSVEAIRAFNDQLYFFDLKREYIGRVTLTEIEGFSD